MQGAGLFLDNKELDLLTDLHTETDLGEGCVPVGRQLGLLLVEASLASRKIIGNFVAPKPSIVMEGFLKVKQGSPLTIGYVHKNFPILVLTENMCIPLYRQSSWPASTLHLRIQSFPCDSKQESFVNQTSADTLGFWSSCGKENEAGFKTCFSLL